VPAAPSRPCWAPTSSSTPAPGFSPWIFPIFLVHVPAYIYLGLWFLYQLIEADFALFSASANGGGVAFFAHVGGFIFGVLVTRALTGAGRITAQQA
jgi:membrane associated rhomboid family serine protease